MDQMKTTGKRTLDQISNDDSEDDVPARNLCIVPVTPAESSDSQISEPTSSDNVNGNIENSGDDVLSRKLLFAIFKPSVDQLREYFSRFGEVESIEMNDDSDGFVQFKKSEGAESALQEQDRNNQMNVSKLYDSHQPESKLLSTLNDDCLKAIFAYLPLKDLCNAADVCEDFKGIANEQFKSRYTNRSVHFDLRYLVKRDYTCKCRRIKATLAYDLPYSARKFDMKFVEQLLRNFGPLIKSLDVCDDHCGGTKVQHENLLPLVNEYCAGTLKELSLFHFRQKLTSSLGPLFAGLEKVSIHQSKLRRNAFSNCSELRAMEIVACRNVNAIVMNFPKLVQLELWDIKFPTENFLDDILRLNDNIEELEIVRPSGHSSINFQQIANRLPELQTFMFWCEDEREVDEEEAEIQENLVRLAQLKTLKRLEINFEDVSPIPLIDCFAEAQIPLEILGVGRAIVDMELLKSLAALGSLQQLDISCAELVGVSLTDVKKLLPKVHELYLEGEE